MIRRIRVGRIMRRLNPRKSDNNENNYLKMKSIYSRQVYQKGIFINLKTNANELLEWDDRCSQFEIVGVG